MRERKKSIFISAIFVFFMLNGVCLHAQDTPPDGPPSGPPPGHSPEEMVEDLTKQLNLTKDQQDKVLKIFEEQFKEMEAMHEKGTRPEPSEMDAMRNELHKKVNGLLNKDQKSKYQEIIKEEEERFKQGPPQKEANN